MDRRIIFSILFFCLLVFFIFYNFYIKKELSLIWPNGGEELRAGKTYQIKWKARKIGKIDIILVNGEGKKQIIAEDFPAKKRKFDWKILAWQEPREDYKILIVEKEGKEKLSDISEKSFTILGPKFFSCAQLSIENQWPFIPSDYPNIKKVFITQGEYNGNFGGLEGADRICQKEAEKMGLEGNFKALLGDENFSAKERLNLEGIFVEAQGVLLPQGEIVPNYFWESFKRFIQKAPALQAQKEPYLSAHKYLEGAFFQFVEKWNKQQEIKYCHRLLGKDFEQFFENLKKSYPISEKRLGKLFAKRLREGVWLGRIEEETRKECVEIPKKGYSFTTTCQNWLSNEEITEEEKVCYDAKGNKIKAIFVGGFALLFQEETPTLEFGQKCKTPLRLICIEQ